MIRAVAGSGPRTLGIALAVLLVVAGCGGKSNGTVSGKISYKGQPLPLGTVAFLCQNGTAVSGMIRDGTFTVSDVPVGPVKITVQVHAPSPMVQPPTGPSSKPEPRPLPAFVPIPERYNNASQSGLTYTVVKGVQTHDLALD